MQTREYEAAKQSQNELEAQVQSAIVQVQRTNSAQVKLHALEDAAKNYTSLYNTYLQRSTESQQMGSSPSVRARFIAPAVVPLGQSAPKSSVVGALAVVAGLALGFGVAVLFDLLDRVFRTPHFVEEQLRLPCIAIVPRPVQPMGKRKHLWPWNGRAKPKPGAKAVGEPRTIKNSDEVFWTVLRRPLSRYAEAIRSIKLSLDTNTARLGRRRIIGLTSSVPGEGKSTTAAALALHIAKTGAKTVLVDLDLRNPTLSRLLADNCRDNIVGVISGACKLQDALWTDANSQLAFLPAPKEMLLTNTTELVGSTQMKQLFEQLSQTYDYVIADLPPLTPLIDSRAAARTIESYLLVVEWGKTQVDTVRQALAASTEIESGLIGVVLNKADIKTMPKYVTGGSFIYMNPDFKRYRFRE